MNIIPGLKARFGEEIIREQKTADGADGMETFWAPPADLPEILRYLKEECGFETLFDLTAIDERARRNRNGSPPGDYTIVYHLLSYRRNRDVRIKAALRGESPTAPSITGIWPSANFYEREAWDMFGISFEGHPLMRRILMPSFWSGHPLRKDHPSRATEMGRYSLSDSREELEQGLLKFRPEDWGITPAEDSLFINLGTQHTGTHGPMRIVLELDGELVVNAVIDIGYHHRGQEKIAERQTWHCYIPYTDRIDYLAGFNNELPYVMAVEKLAGIKVPDRAKVIRVMLTELFRIANHLVWYGTFAQDLGAMSPVVYTFNDRERFYQVIEAVCGGRMHPMWFRIGGVAQDLPRGWETLVRDFLNYMPPKLDEYDKIVLNNRIFKDRTVGVGKYSLKDALDWGVTGPNLRACGFEWDLRKKRPYSGYENFDFEVPTAPGGDCYSRALVRVEEMRQSLRIIGQCVSNMPSGKYKAEQTAATPPLKDRTLRDIETLITHFLGVTWGLVVPPGEVSFMAEGAKGNNCFYLVSEGDTVSYRTRIRTPSFAHIQTVPMIARGLLVSDLIAILGSIDYIPSDIDR